MSLYTPLETREDRYACTCSAERIATSIYHAPGCPKPRCTLGNPKNDFDAFGCPHGDWSYACATCAEEEKKNG